ncbi:hypothetical protein LIER_19220 [Lithospermum erythrorhizon]|uniref:Uncharacterized protein n=1 Tax=Lithospermum erythrorhizon TaxID=34254 RepID=A0AAV3QGV8_LITER
MKSAWDSNANPFDIKSELLELEDIAENAPTITLNHEYVVNESMNWECFMKRMLVDTCSGLLFTEGHWLLALH